MEKNENFGIYLLKKDEQKSSSLKDLLQLMKVNARDRNHSFSYVEGSQALIPHLSLWENLQLVTGEIDLEEFSERIRPDLKALFNLLREPHRPASHSEAWETLTVSLLKGLLHPCKNLLVDVNESLLSPFMVQNLKQTLMAHQGSKTIYLASANMSLWLDCAHSLVEKKEYQFLVENLDQQTLRRHWAA